MKKYIVGAVLSIGMFVSPALTQAAGLTTGQANSIIAVVQAAPGIPASAFINLITAFSNITVTQATSLITVVQAAPGVAPNAFVSLLISFTADTTTQATTQMIPQATTQAVPVATTQPTQSITPNTTVDQTVVDASSNMFTLSGTASNSNSVFVALVKSDYTGSRDWHTIYDNHSYVAFTGDSVTPISNGRWSAVFRGVSDGSYTVLVYDNSTNTSTQTLLGSSGLSVSSSSDALRFVAGSQVPTTLGLGQTAIDGGLQITLLSVSYSAGTSGTPLANLRIDIKGFDSSFYTAKIGDVIPNSGGLTDTSSPTGGVNINVSAISTAMNTITVLVNTVSKG